MNLIEQYNEGIRKLNSLEGDGNHIFDEVGENEVITADDVEWVENHYKAMLIRYEELKIGIFSE